MRFSDYFRHRENQPERLVGGLVHDLRTSPLDWETEAWCASGPTHMIHFNGHNFFGPYETPGEISCLG